MPGLRFFGAQGTVVQFFGFLEALKGHALGGEACYGYQSHALAESPFESGPFLLVKLAGHSERILRALLFVCFERGEQVYSQRIIL